ncbi:MAG: hypothetical protein PVI43_00690 [Candidatus Bathyarchaeota archaeon]|jgi:hypothetical protein
MTPELYNLVQETISGGCILDINIINDSDFIDYMNAIDSIEKITSKQLVAKCIIDFQRFEDLRN